MAEINEELVPGTVYILNEHDSIGRSYSRTDIILRPTPSNDPEDSLATVANVAQIISSFDDSV
ncbi:hypothetical protein OIDMADRAFT_61077 [Oidiodendron maius Zn]|uniref:Uncharacterized protein n=1 Tax=Oidiodendron maius (strain Zn) TaxID=913774 RepID=A0A0C3GCB3_OIDMZ|nr:hypothetical protein OIDMADRAFT_61077 [Oidiodendron maius Zn]